MLSTRTVGTLLATLVVVTGVLLYLEAADEGIPSPKLSVGSTVVTPPYSIDGTASMNPEMIVEVTATIDGIEIDGSPDLIMDGPVNEFSFPVSDDMRGKTVTIVAQAADGTTAVVHVQVH